MPTLPSTVSIDPQGPVRGSLRVPGSKSLTNRALVVAALAEGESRIDGALVAEDSEVMVRALSRLGFEVRARGERVRVTGHGGRIPARSARLDVRLSGTSMRFLTALAALADGEVRLDGVPRMRERPVQHLLDALVALGADASSDLDNGCPPVTVRGRGLEGGRASVHGGLSSQFLSALLMVAPYARRPVELEVEGTLQSRPFVDLTLGLMHDFGVAVERDGYARFRVEPGTYRARGYAVEGDAMAAGYFWAVAAVTGGCVRVANVGRRSRQGDARFADVLERMGCRVTRGEDSLEVEGPRRLRGGTFDLNDMPDQAQTLAAVAIFADAPVRIENVANLRIKETDRLAALRTELARLGGRVVEERDALVVHPLTGPTPDGVTFDTYGDHRMAMALAVVGARLPGVVIRDPGCVAKTYPQFFDDLRALLSGALA